MLILPQIIHNELDVFYLVRSKPGDIEHLRRFRFLYIPPQKIIGGDMKKVRNPYQHIY